MIPPFLTAMIIIPFFGIFAIFFIKESQLRENAHKVALLMLGANLFLSLFLWINFDTQIGGYQFAEKADWLLLMNSFYYLGVDGLSLVLIMLTTFVMFITLLSLSIQKRIKEFLCMFLMLESFLIGLFCSLDIFLFYFFLEASLVPFFLILGIWGGHQRIYTSFKFFVFMMTGSLFILVAIVGIYFYTGLTSLPELQIGNVFPFHLQIILWSSLFIGFAFMIPIWPFHTWLMDVQVEAPTIGGMLFSGVFLKVGIYGLLRLNISLFPDASYYLSPVLYMLSTIGIFYSTMAILTQENIKKRISFFVFIQMGFITLGITSFNSQGISGAILHMVSHGFISAALFFCTGILYDRFKSYDLACYGSLNEKMPRFSSYLFIIILSLIGLPSLSGFIGDILIIVGVFRNNFLMSFIMGLVAILVATSFLSFYQKIAYEKLQKSSTLNLKSITDLKRNEKFVLSLFIIPQFFIGLFPQKIIPIISPTVIYLVEKYKKDRTIKYDIVQDIRHYYQRIKG